MFLSDVMMPQSNEQVHENDAPQMAYIPADSEKKRVILVYLLLWFLLLSYWNEAPSDDPKKIYSVFEEYHIHCSLWRRACTITVFLVLWWTLLIPYLGILSFFLFLSWFVVYGYCLYTAYHWYFSKNNPLTDFLYGLGFRILSLFEKTLPREKDSSMQ